MDEDLSLESIRVHGSTNFKGKKTRKYHQRFRESWRLNKKLRGWIDPPQSVGSTGHCKICKVDLKGSRTLLERHHITNKHKKNLALQGYSIKEESDEEDEEEYLLPEESLLDFDDTNHDEDPTEFKFEPSSSRSNKMKKRKRFEYQHNDSTVFLQIPNSSQMVMGGEEKMSLDDHLTTFGLYVGNELRRISSKYAKQLAKCKINNVIFEVTTGLYNNKEGDVDFLTE